ncbi:MAG: hypothetical protein QM758_28210 [Armatimonas sp.]
MKKASALLLLIALLYALAGCGGSFPGSSNGGGVGGGVGSGNGNGGGGTNAGSTVGGGTSGGAGALHLSNGAPVGTIYFTTNYGRTATEPGKDQLYAFRSDGSGRKLIAESVAASGATGLFFRTLSPDAKYIVYGTSGVNADNQSAVLAKADGSNKRTFVTGGYASDIAFTPDSQRMVYTSQSSSGSSRVAIVEGIDGSGQRTITTGTYATGTLAVVALTPDGTKLAAGGDNGLFVENLDGTGHVALVGTEFTVSELVFSRDGSKVAVTLNHRTDATKSGLYVLNADGSTNMATTMPLARAVPQVGNSFTHNEIIAEGWTPDGKVIFSTSELVDNNTQVDFYEWFVMNPDGSGRQSLARWRPLGFDNIGDIGGGVLSPDKTKLAYSTGEISIVSTAGGTPQQLTNSDPGSNFQPTFNTDGTKICFISSRDDRGNVPGGEGGSGRGTLYIMNADGTGQTRLIDGFSTDRPEAFRKVSIGGAR